MLTASLNYFMQAQWSPDLHLTHHIGMKKHLADPYWARGPFCVLHQKYSYTQG